jgi:hypothetical protein
MKLSARSRWFRQQGDEFGNGPPAAAGRSVGPTAQDGNALFERRRELLKPRDSAPPCRLYGLHASLADDSPPADPVYPRMNPLNRAS